MSPARRQTYHHGDLRSALISAADAIIRQKGIENFSLREAARRACVSPGAPAHHFGGIEGLLTEVALLGYRELAIYLQGQDESETAVAAMRRMAIAYIRFALDHPGRFRLMFRADLVDRKDPRYLEVSARALTEFAATAQNLGRYAGANNMAIIDAWSRVHGMAHLMLEDKIQYLLGADGPSTLTEQRMTELIAAIWPDPAG